jgi:hypothetical protein
MYICPAGYTDAAALYERQWFKFEKPQKLNVINGSLKFSWRFQNIILYSVAVFKTKSFRWFVLKWILWMWIGVRWSNIWVMCQQWRSLGPIIHSFTYFGAFRFFQLLYVIGGLSSFFNLKTNDWSFLATSPVGSRRTWQQHLDISDFILSAGSLVTSISSLT